MRDVLIAGGGIGGLATALALGRVGTTSQLIEQADAFTEVGAGIGLGPNAVRRLQSWGVWEALQAKGFVPSQLEVMDAKTGQQLGCLPMAKAFEQRYGAPYLTIHRADLHQVLLNAVQTEEKTQLHLGHRMHMRDRASANRRRGAGGSG